MADSGVDLRRDEVNVGLVGLVDLIKFIFKFSGDLRIGINCRSWGQVGGESGGGQRSGSIGIFN